MQKILWVLFIHVLVYGTLAAADALTPEQSALEENARKNFCADPALNATTTEAEAPCVACESGKIGAGLSINVAEVQKQAVELNTHVEQRQIMQDELLYLRTFGVNGLGVRSSPAEEKKVFLNRRATAIVNRENTKRVLENLNKLPTDADKQDAVFNTAVKTSAAVNSVFSNGTLTPEQISLLQTGLQQVLEENNMKLVAKERKDAAGQFQDVDLIHGDKAIAEAAQEALNVLSSNEIEPKQISDLSDNDALYALYTLSQQTRNYAKNVKARADRVKELQASVDKYDKVVRMNEGLLGILPEMQPLSDLEKEILLFKLLTAENGQRLQEIKQNAGSSACGLSEAEATALRNFTGSGYDEINGALRKNSTDPRFKAFEAVLNRALRKLNSFDGYLERGGELSPEELAEYKAMAERGDDEADKKIKEWKPFASTSLGTGFPGSTHFIVKAIKKHAHYVASISQYPQEHEAIFESGTKFKVLKYEPVGSNVNITLLELE